MRKLWTIIGRIFFWVTFPALYVYLLFGKRTRVLIWVNNELLVVKGWHRADDRWGLPGGGLHRGEASIAGALREIREETGLMLTASDLTLLQAGVQARGLAHFTYDAYTVRLPQKPEVHVQKGELVDYTWLSLESLDDPDKLLVDDAAQCLEIWKSQR